MTLYSYPPTTVQGPTGPTGSPGLIGPTGPNSGYTGPIGPTGPAIGNSVIVTSNSYVMTNQDRFIGIINDTITNVTLITSQMTPGWTCSIKDLSGNLGIATNQINLLPDTGYIENQIDAVISSAYGSITVVYAPVFDQPNWWIISRI